MASREIKIPDLSSYIGSVYQLRRLRSRKGDDEDESATVYICVTVDRVYSVYIYSPLGGLKTMQSNAKCKDDCFARIFHFLWLAPVRKLHSYNQRVLNDLYRIRLSCVLWFGSWPTPSRQQVVSLSQSSCVSPIELTDRIAGREGGRGAELYDGEKAWTSINHLILSGYNTFFISSLEMKPCKAPYADRALW